MGTIREHITAAMVTLLNTGTPSGVPTATRTRLEQYEPGSLPAISVFPDEESAEGTGGSKFAPAKKRDMAYRVECRAIGDPADTALDPLLAWVTKALDGKDASGYGHVITETGTKWAFDAADKEFGLAVVRLEVQYSTRTGDQEVRE